MNDTDAADELLKHQVTVLRAHRKAMILWLVLAMACVSLVLAAAISWPLLEQNGFTWVLGLFVLAGAGFIYVISAVDKSSKSLWPRDLRHIADAMKSPMQRRKG